jgi:glycosyltransferase involved in cell wall biosynthesis
VVTSAAASLPETVGGAARLVDPLDIASMADGLAEVLSDEVLRKTLVEAGFVRAAALSWDCVAAQTLGVYEEVA